LLCAFVKFEVVGDSWQNFNVMSPLSLEAELAGMTMDNGDLGAPWFPVDRIVVPAHLALDGDRLRWDWYSPDAPLPPKPGDHPVEIHPEGLLDSFLGIHTADEVLGFAKRFGALMICEHGLPASHNRGGGLIASTASPGGCQPSGWPHDMWEPVSVWLHFAARARALIGIAAALHQGKPGALDDWAAIYAQPKPEYLSENLPPAKYHFRLAVQSWIDIGGINLSFRWDQAAAEPDLAVGGGTFAILTFQLVSAITRRQGVAICSNCQKPYLREGRKPQVGRRNFCPDCGPRAASRLRQRDFRAAHSETVATSGHSRKGKGKR